jgi:hypothetical protein
MKQIVRSIKSFFHTHIAMWEEQFNSIQKPAADVNALRSSVGRFYKYNRMGLVYLFLYEPCYDSAIEGLRSEGWLVQLQTGADGELYCAVESMINPLHNVQINHSAAPHNS